MSKVINLLRAVYQHRPATSLTKEGLLYSQIGALITQALAGGLLTYDAHDNLVLTPAGVSKLGSSREPERRYDNGWIGRMESEKTQNIGVDEVYVPARKAIAKLSKR